MKKKERITEDYCSQEVVKLLKEKGFKIPQYYNSLINMWQDTKVTHQMAMKWLREVHNLYICPKYCCFCGSRPKDIPYFKWEARILKLPSSNIIYPHPLDMCKHYDSYEEAIEAALKYSLENLI